MFGAGSAGRVPDEEGSLVGAASRGRLPDGERFPCLTSLFIDPLRPDPLIRAFERQLYAENRSATACIIAVREAVALLRELTPA